MAVNDIMSHVGDYPMMQQDTEDKFHGKHLLYLHWENHPMFAAPFCIPVPRTLPFGAVIMEVLPELFAQKLHWYCRKMTHHFHLLKLMLLSKRNSLKDLEFKDSQHWFGLTKEKDKNTPVEDQKIQSYNGF